MTLKIWKWLSVAACCAGFAFTVSAANNPPTIDTIPDQIVVEDQPTYAYQLAVTDPETDVLDLQLSGASSDTTLVPPENIFFGAAGGHWYLTVTPAFGLTGSATITVTVSDGTNSTGTNFLLTVNPPPAGAARFANASSVTIPDVGTATPYPLTNIVAGMNGTITNLTMTLSKFSHDRVQDVSMLLVSPSGQGVVVFSHVSGGNLGATNVTVHLTDASPFSLPDDFALWSEPLKPAAYPPDVLFPGPAPAGPYGAVALSSFNGQPANGTWLLYVYDETNSAGGSIAGGWSLTVAATGGNLAPTISDVPDQFTTVDTPTAAIPFTIDDADTLVENLILSVDSSNPILAPTNNIVFGGSDTNRTVTVTPASGQTGTATITVTVSDGVNNASDSFSLTVGTVNTTPTMTGIADQTIDEDTPTGAIVFSVGDGETAPGSLTLGKDSSNPSLVPTNNIVFGGSGANRTVTVTPAANQTGAATITVSVTDGQLSTNTSFVVTITPVNDPPTISDIPNQSTAIDTPTAAIPFTIDDLETPAGSLTLSPGSSNPTLVPSNNIVFGGSGATWTVTVTPAAGQTGSATITVTVSDGVTNGADTFVLQVGTTNSPPIISPMTNQTTLVDIPVGPFPFTVGDAETNAVSLTVSATSSDQTLLPDTNFILFNFGATRTMTMIPAAGQTGTATITVTASDGELIITNSFLLTVNPAGSGTAIFSDSAAIIISDVGAATPYPSTIDVDGIAGTITNLSITLHNMSHVYPGEVDMLLVSPSGQGVVIFSSVIGGYAMNDITFTLSDKAFYPLPASSGLPPGMYQPSDYSADHTNPPHIFPAPAPAGPYPAGLSTFNGQSPNGTWSLYVLDYFAALDAGVINGGWSLAITTVSAPTISDIADQSTTVNTATPAIGFQVNDAETTASNLVLSVSSSNPGLVPTSNIVLGGSGTNRTITLTPLADQMGTATITVTVRDGDGMSASDSFELAVNPAPLTVTIDSVSRGYGQTNPVLSGSLSGVQAGDDITLSLSTAATASSPVGIYEIVPTFNDSGNRLGNYIVITNGGTLTVSNALLTITANSTNKVYGDVDPSLTYHVSSGALVNGDNLSGSLIRVAGENVGTYAIQQGTLSAGSNYTLSYVSANFRILRKTLVVRADNKSRIYGQTNPVFTVTYNGFTNGDDPGSLTGTLAFNTPATPASPVGNYAIVPSGLSSPNYTINYGFGTLTVTVRPVTVTADAKSKTYGDVDPSLTYHVSGGSLVNGDSLSGSLIRVAGESVGSYAIQQGALSAGNNYTLSYVGANFRILRRTLLIRAENKSRIYGQSNPVFTATYNGFASGDGLGSLAGTLIFNTPATPASPVGNYAIVPSGLSSPNYTINYGFGTLSILAPAVVNFTSIVQLPSHTVQITGTGDSNVLYSIQGSSDLVHWQNIGAAATGGSGVFQFDDSSATNFSSRFYRIVLP